MKSHLKGAPIVTRGTISSCQSVSQITYTAPTFFSRQDRLKDWLGLLKRKNYPARKDATVMPFVLFDWNVKTTLKEISTALQSLCSLPTAKHIKMNGDAKQICVEIDLERAKSEETTVKVDEFHSVCRACMSSSLLCLNFFPCEKPRTTLSTDIPLYLLC